jgi:hypothetical protein
MKAPAWRTGQVLVTVGAGDQTAVQRRRRMTRSRFIRSFPD